MTDNNSFTNYNAEGADAGQNDNVTDQGQGPSFSNEGTPTDNTGVQPNNGGEVESLKNQIAGLEKRLHDKDEFIEQLKSERRDDSSKVQELQNQISELQERNQSIEQILERFKEEGTSSGDTGQNQLTPEEIEKLALNAVERKQSEQEMENNLRSVVNDLQKYYNPQELDSKISEQATQFGMTFDEAFEMAKTRPKAFRNLFMPQEKGNPGGEPPPSGSINSNALSGQAPPEANKSDKNFMEMSDVERLKAIQERMKTVAS